MRRSALGIGLGSVAIVLGLVLAPAAAAAQIEPVARDRVLAATVQLAIGIRFVSGQAATPSLDRVPVGSGVVVSPTGFILTSWHVVDTGSSREMFDGWEAEAAAMGHDVEYELAGPEIFVLTAGDAGAATLTYRAEVVELSRLYDFAVLQITADAYGEPVDPGELDLAFGAIGDSEAVRQGDPVYVIGFPHLGEGTLQITSGIVSGFMFQAGITGAAWMTTDADIFSGSSGGAAVDGSGDLIGVPAEITSDDCLPPADGDAASAGTTCIPIGEFLGKLRPVHLALPLLEDAGFPPA